MNMTVTVANIHTPILDCLLRRSLYSRIQTEIGYKTMKPPNNSVSTKSTKT